MIKADMFKYAASAALAFGAGAMLSLAAAPAPVLAQAKPKPAAKPAATAAAARRPGNWLATVTRTPQAGYILGNPAARVRLVEYISYTCPHCAHFEIEAADQLKLGMVANGKGAVEVRSFLRNPVDIAATLLAQCGDPSRFFGNHAAFLRGQDKWMAAARSAGPAQQQRWSTGDFPSRMRAIASDLGFYEIMATRGYQRPVIDTCLANEKLANLVAEGTNTAMSQDKVTGTPSFLINGDLQENVHDWAALRPLLMPLTR